MAINIRATVEASERWKRNHDTEARHYSTPRRGSLVRQVNVSIERRPLGSSMVDSRWELAPSVRFPWLGAARAAPGQHRRNQTYPPVPEPTIPGRTRSYPPAPNRTRTIPNTGELARPLTNGYIHWPWDEGAMRDVRHTWSRLSRFSPGHREPDHLTGRIYRPTDRTPVSSAIWIPPWPRPRPGSSPVRYRWPRPTWGITDRPTHQYPRPSGYRQFEAQRVGHQRSDTAEDAPPCQTVIRQ